MQSEQNRPVRLVQIETRAVPPPPSESRIFFNKAYIAFRKSLAFFHSASAYGTARRWLLSTFLPETVLYRWQPYRKGSCNRCGMCCKIALRCPFLEEDSQHTACQIYTIPRHVPPPCLTYPLDPQDLAEVQRAIAPAICPFYFEGQPDDPGTWAALRTELRRRWQGHLAKWRPASGD